MTESEEVAMLNAVVAPMRRVEPPYDAYVRAATSELAFHGHCDASGNICAISATSDVSREGFIAGWMSVAVVEVRTINGRSVSSPAFYLTLEQAQRKEAVVRGELPAGPLAFVWDGWPDVLATYADVAVIAPPSDADLFVTAPGDQRRAS